MKSIINSKIIILITLGILFALLPIITTNLSFIMGNSNKNSEYSDDGNLKNKNLKISAISGKIHINNNWTAAKAAGICTGNGTYSKPYIIEDLVIDGKGLGSAILIENSEVYFRIENCTVYNSGIYAGDAGISLYNVSYGQLISNNCSSNYYGIYLESSDKNTISGNIANNNIHYGIDFLDSDNNTISGNSLSYNMYGIEFCDSDNNTISENNVNNNYLGIDLRNSDNNILSGNTIHNSSYVGVELMGSNNNVLLGNVMNPMGIWIVGSQEQMASQTIDTTNLANDKPIYYYADKVGLRPSNFTNAGQIILVNCNDSFISGFSLTFVFAGISLWYCDNNTLSENTANNNFYGIHLGWSNNTKISGNLIRDNTQYGIYIGWDNQSSQNLIFKNIFLNNTVHSYDDGINNHWNNSIIGNYWDNYTGADVNSDGIGDTPYTFYGGTDYLPIVDTTAPIITINTPKVLEIFGRNAPDFNVEITDILLDTMWYTIDTSVTNITFTSNGTINQATWNSLPEGNVVLRFYANDTLGNIGYSELIIIKFITPPAITIISPEVGDIFGTNPPVYSIDVNEADLDAIWYTLDNGATNITISELIGVIDEDEWNNQPNGHITIRFYANDTFGNIGYSEIVINKDITPPTITIISPEGGDIFGTNPPIYNIDVNDANLDKVWYTLNGGTNITFTGLTGTVNQTLWDALPKGNITIRFYASDSAGNIGFQEVTIVKKFSQPSPPEIPGYDLLFLLGIISAVAIIIIKRRLNHLD